MVLAWWWITWLSRENRKTGTSACQKHARDENMITKVCKRIKQLKHSIGIKVEPSAPPADITVIRTSLYEATLIFRIIQMSGRSSERECSRISSSKTKEWTRNVIQNSTTCYLYLLWGSVRKTVDPPTFELQQCYSGCGGQGLIGKGGGFQTIRWPDATKKGVLALMRLQYAILGSLVVNNKYTNCPMSQVKVTISNAVSTVLPSLYSHKLESTYSTYRLRKL